MPVISVDPDSASLLLVPRVAEFRALVLDILAKIHAEKGFNAALNPRMDCAIYYAEARLRIESGEELSYPVYFRSMFRMPSAGHRYALRKIFVATGDCTIDRCSNGRSIFRIAAWPPMSTSDPALFS